MEQATNQFTKGLQCDTHPMVLSNDTLTDCLNGTLITMNGNEVVLLNDMGNRRVDNAFLPPGYEPVGMKEYGGIIYVAAYNPVTNHSQVGSFPSPERKLSVSDDKTLQGNFDFNLFYDEEKNIKVKDNYGELKFLKNDSFLIPLTGDLNLHVGDKFTVYAANLSEMKERITNYDNTIEINGKKYSLTPKNKEFTLQLGILNSQNEFVDITKSLVRWKQKDYIFEDLIFSNEGIIKTLNINPNSIISLTLIPANDLELEPKLYYSINEGVSWVKVVVNSPENIVIPENITELKLKGKNVKITSIKSINEWEIIDYTNESELYQFNNGYFIPDSFTSPNWESTIKDKKLIQERQALPTNTYAYKLVGPLYLKITLNHINQFDYDIEGKQNPDGSANFLITGYFNYNCPDGYNSNIDVFDSEEAQSADYYTFEEGNPIDILFDLYGLHDNEFILETKDVDTSLLNISDDHKTFIEKVNINFEIEVLESGLQKIVINVDESNILGLRMIVTNSNKKEEYEQGTPLLRNIKLYNKKNEEKINYIIISSENENSNYFENELELGDRIEIYFTLAATNINIYYLNCICEYNKNFDKKNLDENLLLNGKNFILNKVNNQIVNLFNLNGKKELSNELFNLNTLEEYIQENLEFTYSMFVSPNTFNSIKNLFNEHPSTNIIDISNNEEILRYLVLKSEMDIFTYNIIRYCNYDAINNQYNSVISVYYKNIVPSNFSNYDYILGIPLTTYPKSEENLEKYYLENLSIRGYLNFELFGSGLLQIVEWRFFNDLENKKTNFRIGINNYSEKDYIISNLNVYFLKVVEDENENDLEEKIKINLFPSNIKSNSRRTINIDWNTFGILPYQIYKVNKIEYTKTNINTKEETIEILSEKIDENPLERWFLTTELFNDFYNISNGIKDFCDLSNSKIESEQAKENFESLMNVQVSLENNDDISLNQSSFYKNGALYKVDSGDIKYENNFTYEIEITPKEQTILIDNKYPTIVKLNLEDINLSYNEKLDFLYNNIHKLNKISLEDLNNIAGNDFYEGDITYVTTDDSYIYQNGDFENNKYKINRKYIYNGNHSTKVSTISHIILKTNSIIESMVKDAVYIGPNPNEPYIHCTINGSSVGTSSLLNYGGLSFYYNGNEYRSVYSGTIGYDMRGNPTVYTNEISNILKTNLKNYSFVTGIVPWSYIYTARYDGRNLSNLLNTANYRRLWARCYYNNEIIWLPTILWALNTSTYEDSYTLIIEDLKTLFENTYYCVLDNFQNNGIYNIYKVCGDNKYYYVKGVDININIKYSLEIIEKEFKKIGNLEFKINNTSYTKYKTLILPNYSTFLEEILLYADNPLPNFNITDNEVMNTNIYDQLINRRGEDVNKGLVDKNNEINGKYVFIPKITGRVINNSNNAYVVKIGDNINTVLNLNLYDLP